MKRKKSLVGWSQEYFEMDFSDSSKRIDSKGKRTVNRLHICLPIYHLKRDCIYICGLGKPIKVKASIQEI